MSGLSQLSRRERQIMEIVFQMRSASVNDIRERLPGQPTPMAVRRLLAILMEKGLLKRRKDGREYVYLPRQSKQRAGVTALRQVLATFFDGSIGSALATHLEKPGTRLTDEEVQRLTDLIEDLQTKRGDS